MASWFLIYRDVCFSVEEHFNVRGDRQTARTQFLRYEGFGAAGAILDPLALTAAIVDKLAREGLLDLAAELGRRYLSKGENYIERALECASLDSFGGALYTAGLYCFAARQIFFSLRKTAAGYEKAFDVAEEHAVRILTSFELAVDNRSGREFQRHRAKIERARLSGGDRAASESAFQLIEMNYFYPRFYESALLGAAQPRLSKEDGTTV